MGENKICPNCGKSCNESSEICPGCGAPLVEQTELGVKPQYVTLREMVYPKARLWPRFIACLIDGVISMCATIPGIVIACIAAMEENEGLIYVGVIIGAICSIAYNLVKDGLKNGQSYGKRWNGLMVIQLENNEPCTKIKSLIRYLPFLIPYVGGLIEIVMVLAMGNGQRLGDKLAKTQVISADIYNGKK